MTKREEREHLFRLLFCKDFHDRQELPEQVELYEAQLEIEDKEEFRAVKEKFDRILEQEGSIDMLLSSVTTGWKLNRMGKAELTILRIAVYEILHDEDVPDKVAINEAVELAKKYGNDAAAGFVNGVLAKVVKLEQGE